MKEQLLKILGEKNSPIGELLIKNIDIFSKQELEQIYLIVHQTNIEKLKDLFLYQNSQAKAILDRIIGLAQELHHVEKDIERQQQQTTQSELEEYIEQNLDLNYIMS